MPGMRVPGLIFASRRRLQDPRADRTPRQVANVATLPGIVAHSLAMPDLHWGYGIPVGGVAAMDLDAGVASPGGIGFDINGDVRLVRTSLEADEIALGRRPISRWGSPRSRRWTPPGRLARLPPP